MARYVQPNFIVDSSASFLRNVTFDSSVYFQGITHISSPDVTSSSTPYALVVESLGNDVVIKSIHLGSMATKTDTDYVLRTLFDTSISALVAKDSQQDSSLNLLFQKDVQQDASLTSLFTKNIDQDSSINTLYAYNLLQDSSILANWNRWIDSHRRGFIDNSQTSISFADGTQLFTLTDNTSGTGWSYYRNGIKYTINGNKTVSLPGAPSATAGKYYITIQGTDGALTASTTPWTFDPNVIFVATVLWDPSNTPNYFLADERHTMLIDYQMHKYLHETTGTQYVNGGILTGPDVSAGVPSVTNYNNTVGISAASIADEDIFINLPALTRPNGSNLSYVILLRNSGSLSDWKISNVPLSEGLSYIEYDNGTSMVEASPGKYVNTYIAFTDLKGNNNPQFIIIPGQNQFNTLEEAIAESPASFDFTGLEIDEWVIAYQLTWETSTGYSTDGKVALASSPKRINVTATSSSATITTNHNDLLGLQGGNSTQRYHLSLSQYLDFVGKSYVDASLSQVWTKLGYIDSSIAGLDTLTQTHTTDINNLESSVGGLDILTQSHTAELAVHEASIGFLTLYNSIQDASIAAAGLNTKAWNGLTKTDNSIGLGGSLVQDTQILTAGKLLEITGGLTVIGTLTVDGSVTYINSVDLNVSDNIITLNYGETGEGVTKVYSGLIIDRGSSTNYFFGFDEVTDTFRIGIQDESQLPANTQAVATREDDPISEAVPFWNYSLRRFDTNSGLTFSSVRGLDVDNRITANLLTLQNIPTLSSETIALVIASDGSVGKRVLGSNAFSSEVYALDSSLASLRNLVNSQESSIVNINTKLGYIDSSILNLDSLTQSHTAELTTHENSIGFLTLYNSIQDASIALSLNVGAWNGLTKTDNSIGLGGDLSDNVYISGTNNYTVQIGSNGENQFIVSPTEIDIVQKPDSNSTNEIILGTDLRIRSGKSTSAEIILDPNAESIDFSFKSSIITDNSPSPKGLVYANDYSYSFDYESLVSRRFVENYTSDTYLPLNGGTMNGLLTFALEGFSLNGVTIQYIDTSISNDFHFTDDYIATSGAIYNFISGYVENKISLIPVLNGLNYTDGSIKLGGKLVENTSIDLDGYSLTFKNLTSGTTLLALISDNEEIKTQQLGTMALESSSNYYYASEVDTLLSDLSTLTNSNISQLEASIIRIDSSLNDTIELFDIIDASFASVWQSIHNLESSVGGLDTLTQTHTAELAVHEASIGNLISYNAIQDASIAAAGINTKAWNGLTKTDNSIGLGGSLVQATTITASPSNTLTIAGLQTSTVDTPLALVQDSVNTAIKVRQLGTMAWETSTNYTPKSLFDSSISSIWTKFGYVDTSLSNIWTKFGYVDSSISLLENWNKSQDASIVDIRNSQGNYVLKSGDTMTGPLTISVGGLSVANDVSISGKLLVQQSLTVNNDAYIAGTLTIDGSLLVRDVETIDVSSGFIRLNSGMTGTPPSTMQSGIIVERGSELPYVFIYDETLQTFRIGIAPELAGPSFNDASTQAVATRQDNPTNTGVPFWNGSLFRFDTASGFTYQSGKLSVDGSISTPSINLTGLGSSSTENTALLILPSGEVVTRDLGTNAFSSTTYVPQTLFDSSITAIWTKLGYVDSSITGLDTLTQTHTTDINNLESSVGGLDTLTQSHTQTINDLSTNKLDAVANIGVSGSASIFSYESNNTAYLKKIVAGTGATITEDTSTITISVTGAAGYMSKYTGTFNGTSGTSFTILASTHGLGTGPFIVSVYDNNELVYTGVEFNTSGDVTLSWAPGSLTDTACKFIISR